MKEITKGRFSYYQDTKSDGIWKSFDVNDGNGGNKDDVFIFDLKGEMTYIPSSNSGMGPAKPSCKNRDNILVIKTLLEKIKEKDDADPIKEEAVKECRDKKNFRKGSGMKKHNKHKGKQSKENKASKKLERQNNRNLKKLKRKEGKGKKSGGGGYGQRYGQGQGQGHGQGHGQDESDEY